MSLFISVENQNLLYEIIHKTNDIHVVFPQGSPSTEKNEWFCNFIETTYRQLPNNITREQLKSINRKVISTMINSLQEIANKKKREIQTIPVSVINNENVSVYTPLNNRNTIKREHPPDYESKEFQYRSLFEIQKPKPIDFSEKIDDEIITNMSELIEQQKKLRERELQEYAPVPPNMNINLDENIKINILEDVPKDELQSTVFTSFRIEDSERKRSAPFGGILNENGSNEKRVSFSIPLDNKMANNTIVSNSYSVHDYNELKNKIQNIDNKLNSIFELIQKLVPSNEISENNISTTDNI